MRKASIAVSLLLVVGAIGVAMAQCHGGGGSGGSGGSGCPMSGCPGSGLAMTGVSGKITYLGADRDVVKVKVGSRTLQLLVHADCPNRTKLIEQIGQCRVGQTLKGTYYTLNGKRYVCTIGSTAQCH